MTCKNGARDESIKNAKCSPEPVRGDDLVGPKATLVHVYVDLPATARRVADVLTENGGKPVTTLPQPGLYRGPLARYAEGAVRWPSAPRCGRSTSSWLSQRRRASFTSAG